MKKQLEVNLHQCAYVSGKHSIEQIRETHEIYVTSCNMGPNFRYKFQHCKNDPCEVIVCLVAR